MNIRAALGVAGVSPEENQKARKIGTIFQYLVVVALLAVFVQLILSYTPFDSDFIWINYAIWLVFALEFTVNTKMVDNRIRYIKHNWLNLVIIVLAVPWIDWGSEWAIIIRSLRFLLILRFFSSFFNAAASILNKNRFGQILLGFAFLIVGAGGVFVYIEDRPFIDGIWYAIVTVTTVGYGDVVPQTENGRIFGAILIVFGVLFFSLVTANFSAFLIGSEQRKLEKEILGYVQNTEKRLTKLSTENERHVEYIMLHLSREIELLKKELNDLRQKEIQRIQDEILQTRSQAQPSHSEESYAWEQSSFQQAPNASPDDIGSHAAGIQKASTLQTSTNLASENIPTTPRSKSSAQTVEQKSESGGVSPVGPFKKFGVYHRGPKFD